MEMRECGKRLEVCLGGAEVEDIMVDVLGDKFRKGRQMGWACTDR